MFENFFKALGFYSQKKEFIDTKDGLKKIYSHLADQTEIGVDTEFTWRKTYYPILSLIQISTNEKLVIIDCLKLKTDIMMLKNIFSDETTLKIFHSLRSDISVLNTSYDFVVRNIFDTQIAENLIADSKNQKSYKSLVMKYTKNRLSKSETNSNWEQRPLSDKQFHYAYEDIKYLIRIKSKQIKSLISKDLLLDFHELCEKEKNLGETSFIDLRLKRYKKKLKQISALEEKIFIWREKMAMKMNMPPNQVVLEKNLKILNQISIDKNFKECSWIIIDESVRTNFIENFS